MMKSWIQRAYVMVFILGAASLATSQEPTGKQSTSENAAIEVAVMSFNIRNGRARDGNNAWDLRKDFVCDVIAESKVDIVGLQEAFRFQLDEIGKRLPEFGELGEGRDGNKQGEYSAILYRKKRFTAEESGTFWLSDTPDVKSRSWGNRYLRICTWARLKEINTGRLFYVYNTHFDHQSQNARLRSSQLIAHHIKDRTHANPYVLTGDFNADEDNPVILYLKGGDSQSPSPIKLVDTFRELHPDEKMVGTGGGFEGRKDGKKIDYIFVEPGTEVQRAAIVRTQRAGRYPSDHSPVTATVRLGSQP
jgi:endonuclease/exonuclease/phosphatase family metal-dependent hydrolase